MKVWIDDSEFDASSSALKYVYDSENKANSSS